jgi:hypothetical protein
MGRKIRRPHQRPPMTSRATASYDLHTHRSGFERSHGRARLGDLRQSSARLPLPRLQRLQRICRFERAGRCLDATGAA